MMGSKVKGTAFRTIDLCFENLKGAVRHEQARALMLPELAEAFARKTILAASWYPIAWYRDTFQAYRAACNEGLELSRLIGKLAVKHDMSGVHKQLFARMVSPQTLLSLTQMMFRTYYDAGELKIVESHKQYSHALASGCAGWDENMWAELLGSCEAQLELAGAKHVRLRVIAGGRRGDDSCEFDAHWT